MARKKKTPNGEAGKVLVFGDGSEVPVTGEQGKFWICGERQFRKGNPKIVRIEGREAAETPAEDAPPWEEQAT